MLSMPEEVLLDADVTCCHLARKTLRVRPEDESCPIHVAANLAARHAPTMRRCSTRTSQFDLGPLPSGS